MPRISAAVTISLLPGGYFIGGRSCRMRTALGAGIVITLWQRAHWTGAMAHFRVAQRGAHPVLELDGRCGEEGLQVMLQGLQPAPAGPDDCEARICGSGNVLMQTDLVPSFNSGQCGGELARRLLRARGIPIVSESFYALGLHEITFDVHTGRVRARRVKSSVPAGVAYGKAAAPHPLRGNGQRLVTLLR